MSTGLNILSAGMVTAVGLSRAAGCAALRGGLDGFCETQFIAPGGAWLLGAPVPLPRNWIGEKRLAHLAAGAVVDALAGQAAAQADMSVILCVGETTRPGRLIRNVDAFAARVLEFSGLSKHTRMQVVAHGRPSGFVALERARRMFAKDEARHVLIIGVDSLLSGPTIAHYLRENRLLTAENANAFIPGEAAAAILCAAGKPRHFALSGVGLTREVAFIYNPDDLPLRGDGMTQAYRDALAGSGMSYGHVDYRITDLMGESYYFKQSALAMQRLLRDHREDQALWTPADCLGNIGAAFVPLMIGWALEAFEKSYAPGRSVLIEASGDDGACGAAILHGAERQKVAA